jgi:hemolysin III
MPSPQISNHAKHEEFSLPLFVVTVLTTLAVLFGALWQLAPRFWAEQFLAPLWHGAVVVAAVCLLNCFIEYFLHRYVLHSPAIPILRYFYQQHTLHHAITRVGRKRARDGRGILFIENKFPIVEAEQGEASFFPWYTLAVFALLFTPLLAVMQWLVPAFPWFVGGFVALALSLTLYELLHAINHWPFEKWEPLITHRFWGVMWQPIYAFHLRHHAVTDCNESISGFFGLPIADWVFGTCVVPTTVYADGEEWTAEKFRSPRPRWLIRRLDLWANRVVQRRRAIATPGHSAISVASHRNFTRKEAMRSDVR